MPTNTAIIAVAKYKQSGQTYTEARVLSKVANQAEAQAHISANKWTGRTTPYIVTYTDEADLQRQVQARTIPFISKSQQQQKFQRETDKIRRIENIEAEKRRAIKPTTINTVAFGGKTHDATNRQIQEAKSKGLPYYVGGVKYSSSGQQLSRSSITKATTPKGTLLREKRSLEAQRNLMERIRQKQKVAPSLSQGGKTLVQLGTIPDQKRKPPSFPAERATISAASPELKKASKKEQTFLSKAARGLAAGFFQDQEKIQAIPKKVSGLTAGEAGLYAGIIGSFGTGEIGATFGKAKAGTKAAIKATKNILGTVSKSKTSKAVLSGTKQVTQKLELARKTRLGKFVTAIIGAEATGQAAKLSVETGGFLTAPKEQKEFLKQKDFTKSVFGTGLRAEEKKLESQPFYKKLANEVSLFLGGDKKTYLAQVEQIAVSRGLTGKDKENFIKAAGRLRTTKGSAEIASFVGVSAAVETAGQGFIKAGFNILGKKSVTVPKAKAGGKLFWEGFKAIAPAGIIEGATQEHLQQQIRERPFNVKEIATMGLFGGATAGVLGGSVLGLRLGKPKISKALEIGTYITDPYELAGDITSKQGRKAFSKIVKKPLKEATIFEGKIGKVPTIAFAPTIAQTPTKKQPTRPRARTPVQTVTPSPSETILGKAIPPIKTTVPFPQPSPVPVPAPSDTPVINPVITPVGTPIHTPTFIDIITQTSTPTPTGVPINIPINLPVLTPQVRVPPPIPIMLPMGSGRGFAAKGKPTKFVDELALAQNLFKGLTGVGGIPSKPKATKPKAMKKGKMKEKKKKPKFIDPYIDPYKLIFG